MQTNTPPVKVVSPAREAANRAVRTFLQAFLGAFALVGFPILQSITTENFEIDYSLFGRVLVVSAIAGVIAVVSFVQNIVESSTGSALISKTPTDANIKPHNVPTVEVE